MTSKDVTIVCDVEKDCKLASNIYDITTRINKHSWPLYNFFPLRAVGWSLAPLFSQTFIIIKDIIYNKTRRGPNKCRGQVIIWSTREQSPLRAFNTIEHVKQALVMFIFMQGLEMSRILCNIQVKYN